MFDGRWALPIPFPANQIQFLYGTSGILTVPVPESSTFALLAAGLLGLAWRRTAAHALAVPVVDLDGQRE